MTKKKSPPTQVINVRQDPDIQYDIYIGRPTMWGNPFRIGIDGTREQCVAKYREWIVTQPKLLKALPELKGKVLGCYCKPAKCHGDVLAELADAL